MVKKYLKKKLNYLIIEAIFAQKNNLTKISVDQRSKSCSCISQNLFDRN
jgi:hypothetical protein